MIKVHPLESIIEIYLENLEILETTKQTYRVHLHQFIEYLKERNIWKPQSLDVIKFKKDALKRQETTKTVALRLIVIKGLYRWLSENYLFYGWDVSYSVDIGRTVKYPRISKTFRKEPLTLEEVRRLLEVAKQDRTTIWGYRNYAIILLMVSTGIRGVEVTRARKSDLSRYQKQMVLYVQNKGHYDRDQLVKLPLPVVDAINEYLYFRVDTLHNLFLAHPKNAQVSPLTTKQLAKSLKRLYQLAGINSPKKTIHSMRHSAANFNIIRGGSLVQTQKLLRHVHLDTTLIYYHQIERLKDDAEEKILEYITSGETDE